MYIIPKTFWAIGIACLFFACFLAWRDEHRKLRAMEVDVPDFRGRIEQSIMGTTEVEGRRWGMIAAVLSIRNLKAPSIVQGYSCRIIAPSGTVYDGLPERLPPKLIFTSPRWSKPYVLLDSDALYNKVSETPIERGVLKRGLVLFYFPKISSPFPQGSKITICFTDVVDRKYCVESVVTGEGEEPVFFPGTSTMKPHEH